MSERETSIIYIPGNKAGFFENCPEDLKSKYDLRELSDDVSLDMMLQGIDAYDSLYEDLKVEESFEGKEKELISIFLTICSRTLTKTRDNELVISMAEKMRDTKLYGRIDEEKYEDIITSETYLKIKSICGARAWKAEREAKENSEAEIVKQGNKNRDYSVSIVIPVYNAAQYLDSCFECVCGQTVEDIQIICVDDGSTDDSLEKLIKYADSDDRITVIRQNNSGPGTARNRGIDNADGKYIYYVDSDDLIDKDAIEKLLNRMREDDLDLIISDGDAFSDEAEDEPKQNYHRTGNYNGVFSGIDMLCEMEKHGEYRVAPWMQMASTEFIKKYDIRFPEGIFFEDNVYSLRVMTKAGRAGYFGEPVYKRRVRAGSVTTSETRFDHCYGYFRVYQLMQGYLKSLIEEGTEKAYELCDIIYRIFSNVINTYLSVAPEEKYYFYGMKKNEYYFFLSLVYNQSNDRRERSVLKEKLQKTYDEKSEINRKLQKTYDEKAERGVRINELTAEVEKLRNSLKEKEKEAEAARLSISGLERKNRMLEESKEYKVGKAMLAVPRKCKKIIKGEKQ